MQPSTPGGNTPLPVGTLFTPAALAMASQFTTLRLMGLETPTQPDLQLVRPDPRLR